MAALSPGQRRALDRAARGELAGPDFRTPRPTIRGLERKGLIERKPHGYAPTPDGLTALTDRDDRRTAYSRKGRRP